ncbi:hypothetical protein BGX21_007665 [Mortierella sp. AD011]|nr:hypothetical protein BGX20_008131 [Mortierella sp. AD010]KAF9398523.1 hypothetical protein BGX21_007665 [Mortierella sp. AD011]
MPVAKRPLARSNFLALLAVLSLSVLSTSSSALPTSHGHNNAAAAAAIDPIPIIQKRSPDDTVPAGADAGSIAHHGPHTPYAYSAQSPGGEFENKKRRLLKRDLIPFFGQREGESIDDYINTNSDNLDSDEHSFMYDRESHEGDYYLENLRVEDEDMEYDIDDDDHILIEPLYHPKDLFEEDGEEQDGGIFGAGEIILEEDDEYNDSPWLGYRHQPRRGQGFSASPQDYNNVEVTTGGDNMWIVDDWEEDLEDTEEMIDELVDWIEGQKHPGSDSDMHDRRWRQGHSSADDENANGNEGNLRARPLRRLPPNAWTV